MKILLMGFGKIAYMPYMNFYLDTIPNGIQLDLIYWARDKEKDLPIPNRITKAFMFDCEMSDQLPLAKKIPMFIKYRYFAKRIIKQNRYDKIIVLHTTPGLTIIDVLLNSFKGKFVLDFRDITYEYNRIYRLFVGKLVKASALTYVSSDAFRRFLPNSNKIFTIHNYLENSLQHRDIAKKGEKNQKTIVISYWGLIRQVEINTNIMDELGNDMRFELHYYGRMLKDGNELSQYAKEKEYNNVFFHGAYLPEQRYSFASRTDMLHNIYDLGHTTGNAMGNKYYDGVIFCIPQICSKGSEMGKKVEEFNVGITVDLQGKHLGDVLWDYYTTIDRNKFTDNCNAAVSRFVNEQEQAKQMIALFIQN